MIALPWLQRHAKALRLESAALYLAARDPRSPWYAKALLLAMVAYALSPIDLVPDFIPVLGYVDDLLVVPLGLLLARRLVPPEVLAECRARAAYLCFASGFAAARPAAGRVAGGAAPSKTRWVAAGVIALLWIALAAVVSVVAWRALA